MIRARERRAGFCLGTLALLVAGCAGVKHEIVEDRWEISESTSIPEVTDVADVGGGDVPLTGALPMQASDGIAVIGETLWIRGNAFGRQPSVTVGGRPAAVLGRTRDGGIVVRVPIATPTGSQPVVVRNEVGHGERPIAIRRYAAILAPGSGQVAWAELAGDGPIAAGTTAVERARWLAISADGRAAYLAPAARSIIDVVEIPAAGSPKPIYRAGPRPGAGSGAGGGDARPGVGGRAGSGPGRGRHHVAAAPGAQRAPRAAQGAAQRRDRGRRRVARRQAAGPGAREQQPGDAVRSRGAREGAGGRDDSDPPRRQSRRPRGLRVLAGGRHALGAVRRHAAEPADRPAADGAARGTPQHRRRRGDAASTSPGWSRWGTPRRRVASRRGGRCRWRAGPRSGCRQSAPRCSSPPWAATRARPPPTGS